MRSANINTACPRPSPSSPIPLPHRELTQAAAARLRGAGGRAWAKPRRPSAHYLERLASRVRFYRFFFFAPLVPGAAGCFYWPCATAAFSGSRLTLAVLALGTNFYPYFYPHYIAAVTCLFVLVSVVALERMSRLQIRAARRAEFARLILESVRVIFSSGTAACVREAAAKHDRRTTPGISSITAIPRAGSPSTGGWPRRPASNWSSSATGPSTSSTNGFKMRPASTARAWCGRSIWAPARMKSCGAYYPGSHGVAAGAGRPSAAADAHGKAAARSARQ